MRIDTAGDRGHIQCGPHTERERSEIERVAHECASTGRTTCTAQEGQGEGKQACTTSAKIVREG
jgi:hypothetical protein